MLLRLIPALVALLLVSCATSGGTATGRLLGRWRSTNQDQTAEYVFAADGTFSGNVSSRGAIVSRFTGKWSLRDGAILYEYTGDPTGTIPVGTRDRDRLVQVAKDYFEIQAADGSRRRYVRVAP